MSDQPLDIASFFDKEQQKKKKTQKSQQLSKQKQLEQQQRQVEEVKKATKTGDFESSEEEEATGQLVIGEAKKVKDIKEVKKEKQLAQDAQKGQAFQWGDLGKGVTATTSAPAQIPAAPAEKEAGGRPKFENKGANFGGPMLRPGVGKPEPAPAGLSKDGITFGKPKPSFTKKADTVVKKGDFPELGDDTAAKGAPAQTKAAVGGPIGQMSAPARGARTQNQFQTLAEEEKQVVEAKPEAPKERPRFTGSLKGLLGSQNVANADANKNLPELQKKLQEQIVIHEAKPPRREEGQEESKEPKKPFVPHERSAVDGHRKIDSEVPVPEK
jgi:hypothetical protein